VNRIGYIVAALAALVVARPAAAQSDHAAIVDGIAGVVEEHLYDPGLADHPRVQRFLERARSWSSAGLSDAAFASKLNEAASELPFTHFNVRPPGWRGAANGGGAPGPAIETDRLGGGIALHRVRSFNSSDPALYLGALREIVRQRPEALIVDLRNNRGGNFMSLLIAAFVVDERVEVGTLFAPSARDRVLAGDVDGFPTISPTQTSVDSFNQTMRRDGAIRGFVEPLPDPMRFDGPVAILTDGMTGSACEPMVEVLKRIGRATIVGEKTAGAMLDGDVFELPDGWSMFAPVFDYVTAEGERLDRVGVAPDLAVPADRALEAAKAHLRGELR